MKPTSKPKKPQSRAKRRLAVSADFLPKLELTGKPGDAARILFDRWRRENRDPKPITWERLKATMEKNRLREAPLFDE
jgi:hypothetical protein